MSAFFSFAQPFVDMFSKFQMANIQNENQEYLLKKQHQYNLDAMNKTNSQNIMNALEAGSIERASKEKAGLNKWCLLRQRSKGSEVWSIRHRC